MLSNFKNFLSGFLVLSFLLISFTPTLVKADWCVMGSGFGDSNYNDTYTASTTQGEDQFSGNTFGRMLFERAMHWYLSPNVALYSGQEDYQAIVTLAPTSSPWFVTNGIAPAGSFVDTTCGPPPPPPPPPGTDLPSELSAAYPSMASTTGFNILGIIDWSGTNLIEVSLGSALGVILGMRYWIIVTMVIASILAFSFRGFQFFRH